MLLLPRFLSRAGVASRKAAEEAVFSGHVTVDGVVCRDVLRVVVPGRDRVAMDGRPVSLKAEHIWLALNKARGTVTTTHDPQGRPTVMDAVAAWARPGLAPVGRLDADTGGLLLFTDDHALASALLEPAHHVEKVYRAKVHGHLSPETLAALKNETREVDGLALGPMGTTVTGTGPRSTWLELCLAEGKNRQIRRRLEAEGHPVEVLVRVAFGPIRLGTLAPGEARVLAAGEVAALRSGVIGAKFKL